MVQGLRSFWVHIQYPGFTAGVSMFDEIRLLSLLMAIFLGTAAAAATERVVLFEEFTNTS